MTTATTILIALTLATPTTPETRSETGRTVDTTEEALAILRKADEATKAVQAIRYRARAYGTEWLAKRTPEVDGTAVISGRDEIDIRVARFDTTVRFPGHDGARKLTYGADGTFYYLLDWDQMVAYEDADRRVTGDGGRAARQIGLREFVHETPFADEINGESVALLAGERIGKEPCYVVDVVYAENQGRTIWYFSKRDHLPRRVDRVYDDRARGVAKLVVELYDLEPDPEIADLDFALTLPEGFDKSPHFAPDVTNLPW